MYSQYASIFSQIIDDKESLNEQYDILAGKWPSNYNELTIVLSEPHAISDLLVYFLGLRDIDELYDIVSKMMAGEKVDVNNKPMEFTYQDFLNIDLRLINQTDIYKYNSKYDIYENMSEDNEYMEKLYDNALKLKIVGVVAPKDGVTSMALNPGVVYNSDLINYIVELKEIVLETMSCIFTSVEDMHKTDEFVPYAKYTIEFINRTLRDEANLSNEIVRSSLGLIADFCKIYGKNVYPILDVSLLKDKIERFKRNKENMENEQLRQFILWVQSEISRVVISN